MSEKLASRMGDDPLAWLHDGDRAVDGGHAAKAAQSAKTAKAPKAARSGDKTLERTVDRTVDKNTELLEQSFNLLAPRAEELVARFYDRLFFRYPAVRPLFAHTQPKQQQTKLLASLKLVVNNLRKPEV